ncbi:MAG: hypothetical protein ACPG31_03385 [Planctomycetota bacterium]
MLLPLLLSPLTMIAPLPDAQQTQVTRLEVTAQGVFEVHPQMAPVGTSGSTAALVTAPRWQEDDLGLA